MTSVKTSADLNLKRSSTRVHNPPGGSTSIDLGGAGYERPAPLVKVTDPVVEVPPPPPAAAEEASTETAAKGPSGKPHQVGIVIVEGPGSAEFVAETKKSFAAAGLNSLLFMPVADVALLTYAAQNLLVMCEVVVGGVVLVDDAIGANKGTLSQTLVGGLVQLGLLSASCVVPAVVSQSSLLEAKAVLPALSQSWARACSAALAVKAGAVKVDITLTESPPPPVVVTEAVDSVQDLLTAFKQSMKARGASGIAGISRKFRIADDNNSGDISFAEFEKLVSEHTLGWTPAQVKKVFDYFDADHSGSIVFDEFLVGLRGELNQRRRQLVLMAFEILDTDKSGVIEVSDIEGRYDASKHPDVIANKRSSEEILREFLDTFDQGDKDGKVTPDEFCKYYSNVSSSIDNDDYFELMIRNAWHMSGGEGWCANTSCRRVLVTHADGTQTVEEIKNDLGIAADDKAAMIANLEAQGIKDVVGIDTKGSADNTTPPTAAAKAPSSPEKKPAAGAAVTAKAHKRIKGGESTIVFG